jgi:hypothetical protein
MNQEQDPRFSHIAIGTPPKAEDPTPDPEEVTLIGAVPSATSDPTTPTPSSVILSEAKDPASTSRTKQDVVVMPTDPTTPPTPPTSTIPTPDDDFGKPMPTAQKIVLVACLVGLIIAIIFIVNYWL